MPCSAQGAKVARGRDLVSEWLNSIASTLKSRCNSFSLPRTGRKWKISMRVAVFGSLRSEAERVKDLIWKGLRHKINSHFELLLAGTSAWVPYRLCQYSLQDSPKSQGGDALNGYRATPESPWASCDHTHQYPGQEHALWMELGETASCSP
jgi:hypothetical protein